MINLNMLNPYGFRMRIYENMGGVCAWNDVNTVYAGQDP